MESDVGTGSGDRVDTGRAWFGTAIAVVGLLAAVWVASAYIDQGDSTCSSVWHPGTRRYLPSCTTPMIGRTVLAIGLAVGAIVVYLVAWRLWRPPAPVARYAALVLLLASVAAVAHTEVVRRDGAFGPNGLVTDDGPDVPPSSVLTIPVPSLDPP
jgi:hypothetical protein